MGHTANKLRNRFAHTYTLNIIYNSRGPELEMGFWARFRSKYLLQLYSNTMTEFYNIIIPTQSYDKSNLYSYEKTTTHIVFFPVCKSFYRPKRLNWKYVDFYHTIENESSAIIFSVEPNGAREEVERYSCRRYTLWMMC